MNKTRIEIELITPTYLGGANRQPELRTPSFKGLLRFWYRAIDPSYRKNEPEIFGDTNKDKHGGAPIGLRLVRGEAKPRYCYLLRNEPNVPSNPCVQMGRTSHQGLRYLAFPMGMSGGERTALAPSQHITIDCTELKQNLSKKITEGFAMAWWGLLTLGGIGARSRRGFGSLGLVSIDSSWRVSKFLTQYQKVTSVEGWWTLLEQGLSYTKKWYRKNGEHSDDHFHIGKGTRFLLFGDPRKEDSGFSSWINAMDDFGTKLRDFRKFLEPEEKASFGLPIQGRGLRVKVKDAERGASPVMMKVVRIGSELFNLITLSRSPICKANDTLSIQRGRGKPYNTKPDYGILDSLWHEWKDEALRHHEVV